MKLEDVLLTAEEIDHAHDGKEATDSYEWDCDINKSQCLKLLEWQKKWCTSHVAKRSRLGWTDRRVRRWECPYCDAELEKLLKEG